MRLIFFTTVNHSDFAEFTPKLILFTVVNHLFITVNHSDLVDITTKLDVFTVVNHSSPKVHLLEYIHKNDLSGLTNFLPFIKNKYILRWIGQKLYLIIIFSLPEKREKGGMGKALILRQ